MILVVVAIAQLMVVLDATIVNIALPSAQRALGFPNSDRQWVVTAYALAFGSLLLVGGRLGDMFSRKRVFIVGLVGFAVASAIGGAAGSFTVLVTARALQGAFGAVLAPSALGTLVSTFQDPRERGRAFGVYGSVAAGGGGIGLILGGLLTQYLSWRWCLYVNLLFAAIAVAGAVAYIRSNRPADPPRMDWPGAVLAGVGLFLIVYGFSHAETSGWGSALTVGSLVAGPVLLVAFVLVEQRSSHPLLPLRVIVDRARGGSYVAVFISGIGIFGTFLFLTFYMQQIKGYSPLNTGLLFLPLIGCILVTSNLASIIGMARVGPRVLIAGGMLLAAGGTALLTQVSVTSSYVGGVLPALIIMGLGFGMIFAPAINSSTLGVRREDSGVASALVNTMQQVGGSIGTSALSTFALSATASYLVAHHTSPLAPAIAATHGYTVAFAISAALLGLGFILAIVMLPSKRRLDEAGSAAAPAAAAPSATAPAAAAPSAAAPSAAAPDAAAPAAAMPASATPASATASASAQPASAQPAAALQPGFEAIPCALCSCSPVVSARREPADARAR
jgi:EmrB/QacA subfamily drug resistance transporter